MAFIIIPMGIKLSFVSIKGIINDDDDDNDFNKDNDDNTYNTDDDDEGCRR